MKENISDERKYKVYVYTNKVNGKKYVGQTCRSLKERAGKDGKLYKDCIVFNNAIQKYGWNNFYGKIIFDNLTHSEANQMEIKMINILRTSNKKYGYNIAKGGTGGNNKPVTPVKQYDYDGNFISEFESATEAAKYMECRTAQITYSCKYHGSACGYLFRYAWEEEPKDQVYTLTHNQLKLRKSTSDNKPVLQFSLNGEFVKKYMNRFQICQEFPINSSTLREVLTKYKKHTYNNYIWLYEEDYNKNGGQSYINKIVNTPTVPNKKIPVCQFDLNMNYIETYESTKSASAITGIEDSSIYNVLNGKSKTAGSYIWMRETDYLNGNYNKEKIINNIKPQYHKSAVVQLDLEKHFIKSYESLREASQETNINRSSIGNNCCHRYQTAGGFIWMYKSEYDKLKKYSELIVEAS